MQYTLYTTPVVNTALRALSLAFLGLRGWQLRGSLPPGAAKSVLIAVPHTSNWDLPYTLMVGFALRLNLVWMGKASLFRWPFGGLMRWLGGIAVDREHSANRVAASAAAIARARPPLQLVVAPQGTRGGARKWRTGFYFIALQAGVPVVPAYLDYAARIAGLGPPIMPTGEVDRDLAEIERFYAGVLGPGMGSRVPD